MLTDEQIRALHDRAATLGWLDVALKPDTIRELCTRVLEAEARVKVLETEGAQLAANQCHDGYGDEWGNHRCRAQDTLRARVKALEDALREIAKETEIDHIGDRWQTAAAVYARKALERTTNAD